MTDDAARPEPARIPAAGYPPPPPYGPPAYPSPPYGAPGTPHPAAPPFVAGPPAGYAPAVPAVAGRGLGLAATIIGAIPLLIGFAMPFLVRSLYRSSTGAGLYQVVSAGLGFATFACGVTAIILGAIAVSPRRSARAWGGVGLGLGVAAAAGALSGGLYGLIGY